MICIRCKLDKQVTEFYNKLKHCIVCNKLGQKLSRQKNQTAYNKAAKDRRNDRKARAIEYKGKVCYHCLQQVHPAAFDFHHLNKHEKDIDPGLMMGSTDEILFKELDKCVLLCSNCHRI